MTAQPSLDDVSALIAAVAAAEIMPRFRALGQDAIRTKSHAGDLVTDADEAAERALSARLMALLPGSVVVGEEAAYAQPALLDRIGGDDAVWIIDPVDGTSNFVHGRPLFATIVALVRGGETVAGWIHDPVNLRTAVCERGAGAWMTVPGESPQRLAVGQGGRPLSALTACIGLKTPKGLSAVFAHVARLGSAAHNYLALAEARMDVGIYSRLMPWDHAAGVLLHAEAGGHAALTEDDLPYRPTRRSGSLLLAQDVETWQAVKAQLMALR